MLLFDAQTGLPVDTSLVEQAGYICAYQDRCENVPFGSVGGLSARPDLQKPTWVKEEDWDEYKKGYIQCCTEMWGEDWATCEFGWHPVLRFTEDGCEVILPEGT